MVPEKPMDVQVTKQRALNPPKALLPPVPVIRAMRAKEKNKLPSHPFLRFLKVFFGEGF